ncbi:MAG: hypothetical protein ACI7YS_17735 [Flavobacterium sp.]
MNVSRVIATSFDKCQHAYLVTDDNEHFAIISPEATYHERNTPCFWGIVEHHFPKQYESLPANREVEPIDEMIYFKEFAYA